MWLWRGGCILWDYRCDQGSIECDCDGAHAVLGDLLHVLAFLQRADLVLELWVVLNHKSARAHAPAGPATHSHTRTPQHTHTHPLLQHDHCVIMLAQVLQLDPPHKRTPLHTCTPAHPHLLLQRDHRFVVLACVLQLDPPRKRTPLRTLAHPYTHLLLQCDHGFVMLACVLQLDPLAAHQILGLHHYRVALGHVRLCVWGIDTVRGSMWAGAGERVAHESAGWVRAMLAVGWRGKKVGVLCTSGAPSAS